MAYGTLTKSLIVTAPVIAAVVISLTFGINAAINPKPTATFTPFTSTTRPPTTTTRPPATTAPATTTAATTSTVPTTTK